MVIAGADGHALEVLDVLISQQRDEEIVFFDELSTSALFEGKYAIFKTEEELKSRYLKDSRFILGTWNPKLKKRFLN